MSQVRITSKRKGGIDSDPSETIVDVDRVHPILGNRHILKDHRDDVERAQVIDRYRQDLEADWARSGPMSQAIKGLAARVGAGERMALRCWCAPKPCHAELIRYRIAQVLDMSPEDLAPRDVSDKRMAQARLF
jgi:Domain of unknown function (DUF4326)